MDCREAQMLLSASQDREELHDATAASIAAHCRTCPECGAFNAQLGALNDLGSPRAPADLGDRIAAAVFAEYDKDAILAEEAAIEARIAADAAAAAIPTDAPMQPVTGSVAPPGGLRTPAWLTSGRLWLGTAAVTLSAAAVVVGLVVAQQGADQSALTKASEEALQRAVGAPSGQAPGGYGTAATPPQDAAVVRMPDYVEFNGAVYAAAQSTDATASQLTTVGAVQSALNMGSIQSIPVLRSSGDARTIYLVLPGGAHQRFDPVVRAMGGRAYQLQAGVSLDRYGTWPRLPSNLPTPTAKDGSPAFAPSGTDDAGVTVYVRVGDTAVRGFALAPGTAPGDPGAGNPNWTWWLPVP